MTHSGRTGDKGSGLSGVPEPKRPPSKPGLNKYRARATVYRGVKYHSKAEADRAAELDLLLKAGKIVDWIGQPTVRLGVSENVYRPDFLVIPHPVRIQRATLTLGEYVLPWYEDIKGMETPKFRRDKKLWRAYGRLPLIIRKNGREVERIEPEGR